MADKVFTYQQLDSLLLQLGFTRSKLEPKWLHYEHKSSGTEITLIEKNPSEPVRPTDAWSAREHLIQKGLISEEELDKQLNCEQGQPSNRRRS